MNTQDLENLLSQATAEKPLSESELKQVRMVIEGFKTLKAWGKLGKAVLFIIPTVGAGIITLQKWGLWWQ